MKALSVQARGRKGNELLQGQLQRGICRLGGLVVALVAIQTVTRLATAALGVQATPHPPTQ